MMARRPVALLIFGEGGHSEAMRRVWQKLDFGVQDTIQLHERIASPIPGIRSIRVSRIMPKEENLLSLLPSAFFLLENALVTLWVFVRYDVKYVLTTGPMVALAPAIACRILGIPCTFIESWARFTSLSRTARALNWFGAEIWYQNWEMASKSTHGRYCGRL